MADNIFIGRISDLYFDDETYKIEDLVIDKGFINKSGEQHFMVNKFERLENKILILRNSKEDSKRQPIMHTDYLLARNFGWPNIWSIADDVIDENGLLAYDEYTPNLRSVSEVQGYKLETGGKYLGYISDILIECDEWKIKSFLINKNKFLPAINKEIIDAGNIRLEINYPTANCNQ